MILWAHPVMEIKGYNTAGFHAGIWKIIAIKILILDAPQIWKIEFGCILFQSFEFAISFNSYNRL